MNQLKESFILIASIFLLVCSIVFITEHTQSVFFQHALMDASQFTVVIDAGHGGFDSGKVGVDGTLEKDVNLIIAKKLEQLLIAADINVIMTRTDDTGLYEESSNNKKRQDMKNRATLMDQAKPDCIISIHQNSYPKESIDGAQVFIIQNLKKESFWQHSFRILLSPGQTLATTALKNQMTVTIF